MDMDMDLGPPILDLGGQTLGGYTLGGYSVSGHRFWISAEPMLGQEIHSRIICEKNRPSCTKNMYENRWFSLFFFELKW